MHIIKLFACVFVSASASSFHSFRNHDNHEYRRMCRINVSTKTPMERKSTHHRTVKKSDSTALHFFLRAASWSHVHSCVIRSTTGRLPVVCIVQRSPSDNLFAAIRFECVPRFFNTFFALRSVLFSILPLATATTNSLFSGNALLLFRLRRCTY